MARAHSPTSLHASLQALPRHDNLCTCGTSAAKKLFGQPIPFNAAWVADRGGIEPAAKHIYQSFKDASMADETALKRDLSAKIHSFEGIDPLARRALDRFKSILNARYGSHLRGLYLFGSRARGDHRPDSDADVAVVLDVAVDPLGEQLALVDLGYDILLDTGVYIQPWVVAQDDLDDPPNRYLDGLLGAMRHEGVAL